MPRGDPVHGVGVVRDPDAGLLQLVAESYRPRAGAQRRRRQLGDLRRQLLGTADERLPGPLPRRRVERREDLAAKAVEDRQPLALAARRADRDADRVEGADAARRQAGGGGEPARRRDPDPQPGEGAGAEPDADPLDRFPAADGGDGALDLLQQPGRVQRPAAGREPQPSLVGDLAVAPGADGGIGGSGVEADDDQGTPLLAR